MGLARSGHAQTPPTPCAPACTHTHKHTCPPHTCGALLLVALVMRRHRPQWHLCLQHLLCPDAQVHLDVGDLRDANTPHVRTHTHGARFVDFFEKVFVMVHDACACQKPSVVEGPATLRCAMGYVGRTFMAGREPEESVWHRWTHGPKWFPHKVFGLS